MFRQLCLNSGFSVAEADVHVGLSVIVLTEFLKGGGVDVKSFS